MTVDYQAIQDALVSVAQRTGQFEAVAGHEPKSAPGKGLTCFVFYAGKRAIGRGGLNSTSVRLNWSMQVRCSMTREPQSAIDVDMLAAVDAIEAGLSDNYTLDVSGVRGVDVLGAEGDPLGDDAGYINHDNHLYRVMTVNVGVIVNDAWSQDA